MINNKEIHEIMVMYLSVVFDINIELNMLEYECTLSIFKNIINDNRRLDPDRREYYLYQYTKSEAESIILNWKLGRI